MEFANDPIARRIREAAGRGTLSHALLFSGSGDRIAAAQYAAAAMECQGGGQKPCRDMSRLPQGVLRHSPGRYHRPGRGP